MLNIDPVYNRPVDTRFVIFCNAQLYTLLRLRRKPPQHVHMTLSTSTQRGSGLTRCFYGTFFRNSAAPAGLFRGFALHLQILQSRCSISLSRRSDWLN